MKNYLILSCIVSLCFSASVYCYTKETIEKSRLQEETVYIYWDVRGENQLKTCMMTSDGKFYELVQFDPSVYYKTTMSICE